MALLLTFLAAAGNILGLGPRAPADAAPHPARLNVVLVGQTSRARKGTAWAQVRNLLAQVDPSWTSGCVLPGIASGEALIAEVRDGTSDEDLGVADTEAANGFANRFLFALVRRSKRLPEGGQLDPAALDDLAAQVGRAIERAYRVGVLRRDADARQLWAKVYEDFGDGSDGLAGAITARPEAQTLRLSVAYAVLDGSQVIRTEHIQAALAVWSYCEASALVSFGDALGDPPPTACWRRCARLPMAWTAPHSPPCSVATPAPPGSLRPERCWNAGKGLIVTEQEETGGRPRLVSRAVMGPR